MDGERRPQFLSSSFNTLAPKIFRKKRVSLVDFIDLINIYAVITINNDNMCIFCIRNHESIVQYAPD